MAVSALKATYDLIKEHEKVMDEEKEKLKKCSSNLDNYHQQIEEIMESLKSIDLHSLNISHPLHQRLHD
jgi:hypothetical protein